MVVPYYHSAKFTVTLGTTCDCIGRHVVRACSSLYMKALPSYTVNYTHAQRVTICCHNTNLVHVNGHDRIIFVIFSQALYKAP